MLYSRGRSQMTIKRMHFAYWIAKATDTHLEYVIPFDFSWQQCLLESISVLRYTYIVCLVLLCVGCMYRILEWVVRRLVERCSGFLLLVWSHKTWYSVDMPVVVPSYVPYICHSRERCGKTLGRRPISSPHIRHEGSSCLAIQNAHSSDERVLPTFLQLNHVELGAWLFDCLGLWA